jgi:hypothetical protein
VSLPHGGAPPGDSRCGEAWGPDRQVRAQLIAQLLTGVGPNPGPPRMLRLRGARITGALNLESAVLRCPLILERCWLEEELTLESAEASVIWLDGSFLCGKLAADELHTGRTVSLGGVVCSEEVSFRFADIGGLLNCAGSQFDMGIWLRGAHISGQLIFSKARLNNAKGTYALIANRLTVDQDMFCGRGFTAEGEVRLTNAHIGGQLDFSDAHLSNPKGNHALTAHGLTVGQDMMCNGLTTAGEIRLVGGHIGRQFSLRRANLNVPNADTNQESHLAFNAARLTVDRDMVCGEGFRIGDELSLRGARIGGQLSFADALLDGPCVVLKELQAAEVLLRPKTWPRTIDFAYAKIRVLADGWQPKTPITVHTDGFTYDTLDEKKGKETSAQDRLEWLGRDPNEYTPQPYEQLAAVYRTVGEDEAARQVLIGKQRVRRAKLRNSRAGPIRALRRAWDWFLDSTIGYGYRPLRILSWAAGLLLVGSVLFNWLYDTKHIVAKTGQQLEFHAVPYALDLLLPVVGLKQRDGFVPQGQAVWWVIGFTLTGWLLGAILVAGLTGVFKRD